MTQYRTYLDASTQAGQETILGIQQNGSEFGVGVSTDVVCNNISAGIVTSTGGFVSIANTTPIQIILNGNQLTFNAVGIGSTTFVLA
jgi:hypothetical protein